MRKQGIAALGAGALWLCAPAAAGAADERWDQRRVAELADELSEAADRFEEALERQPAPTAATGTPESAERLRQSAERLDDAADALEEQLAAGEGRAETDGLYKRVSQLAADSAESARNQMLSQDATREWEAFRASLEKLAPYYEARDDVPAERLDTTP